MPEIISLSDQNWMDIEKAYGQNLSVELRQHILDITNSFARVATIEQNAPPPIQYTDDLIAQWFNNQLITLPLSQGTDLNFEVLTYILGSLVSACDAAERELEFWSTKQVWKEGVSWNQWVKALTELMRHHSLPYAASISDDTPSPFVRLVGKLQELLPQQYRRSTQSAVALAQAIKRARNRAFWDTNG